MMPMRVEVDLSVPEAEALLGAANDGAVQWEKSRRRRVRMATGSLERALFKLCRALGSPVHVHRFISVGRHRSRCSCGEGRIEGTRRRPR